MASVTESTRTPIPKAPWWQGSVFAFCVSVLAGLSTWFYLARQNDYQPLYEIKVQSKKDNISFNLRGPWIVTFDHLSEDSALGDLQFRHLATGKLAYELIGQCMPGVLKHLPATDADPNHGLIARNIRNPVCDISLIQPHLQQTKTIHKYEFLKTVVQDFGSSECYCSYTTLDMAPFRILNGTGLPDVLAMQFLHYLGGDSPYPVTRVALVRVYSSRTGKLISTCSMPVPVGAYSFPILLNDGEHFVLPVKPHLPRLGNYFLHHCTTDERKQALGSNMPGIMLFNHRTGQIAKEWKDIKGADLDPIDDQHILLHTFTHEPLQHWAISRPANQRRHLLLNNATQQMIDLPTSPSANNVAMCRTETGYQLFQYENLPAPSNEARCTWMLLDAYCKVLETRTWINPATPDTMPILNSQQMIVAGSTGGLLKSWDAWCIRFPILKRLPFGPQLTACVYDFASDQKLLRVQGESLCNFSCSDDGKYLVIAYRNAGTPTSYEVKVYSLPLVPHDWWANWLPAVAGYLTVITLWCLLWCLRSRQVKRIPR